MCVCFFLFNLFILSTRKRAIKGGWEKYRDARNKRAQYQDRTLPLLTVSEFLFHALFLAERSPIDYGPVRSHFLAVIKGLVSERRAAQTRVLNQDQRVPRDPAEMLSLKEYTFIHLEPITEYNKISP